MNLMRSARYIDQVGTDSTNLNWIYNTRRFLNRSLLHRQIRNLKWWYSFIKLSCVVTVVLSVRLLHAVAFSKKLPWFELTYVISLKMQSHAVNACVKRSSQCSFSSFHLTDLIIFCCTYSLSWKYFESWVFVCVSKCVCVLYERMWVYVCLSIQCKPQLLSRLLSSLKIFILLLLWCRTTATTTTTTTIKDGKSCAYSKGTTTYSIA